MTNKGKTCLPDPFPLTLEMIDWANENVPTLDVEGYYHEEFCLHWWGNGKMMKSWPATWKNWMKRTDKGAGPGMYGPDDRRIVRKRPKPVPQGELPLTQLSDRDRRIKAYQDYRDYLYRVAFVENNIYVGAKSAAEIEAMLDERGIEYDKSKRPEAARR